MKPFMSFIGNHQIFPLSYSLSVCVYMRSSTAKDRSYMVIFQWNSFFSRNFTIMNVDYSQHTNNNKSERRRQAIMTCEIWKWWRDDAMSERVWGIFLTFSVSVKLCWQFSLMQCCIDSLPCTDLTSLSQHFDTSSLMHWKNHRVNFELANSLVVWAHTPTCNLLNVEMRKSRAFHFTWVLICLCMQSSCFEFSASSFSLSFSPYLCCAALLARWELSTTRHSQRSNAVETTMKQRKRMKWKEKLFFSPHSSPSCFP